MLFEKQIEKIYKGRVFARCDDRGVAYYFSEKDFPGLKAEKYDFISKKGNLLKGKFYYYENPIKNRIVVFDHGFGGGHLSYMKEIERLCRDGFLVFSYDHTGCMESEGETPGGLGQSLMDLDDCLTALKKEEKLKGYDFSVMGHSWGGFSTLNISALHPEISHVVVMSGFISVEKMLSQFFPDFLKGYRNVALNIERESNPESLKYNAVDTLKNMKAKALLIYSDNDKAVNRALHYDTLYNALKDKENITFRLETGKGHNPDYTKEAVGYFSEYMKALATKQKKNQLSTEEKKADFVASMKWDKITELDEGVFSEIIEFLKA